SRSKPPAERPTAAEARPRPGPCSTPARTCSRRARNMAEEIRGFAFPFAIDSRTGGVAAAVGSEKLRQNLKHLLLTRFGERAMLREYGGGVSGLYQENIDDGLIAVARHQVAKAIVRF